MTLQKGDFILIDYTGKVKETNEVFDTTKEEVAKKEHLHKEGEIYEPKLVVVGEGWVLKALDDALHRSGSRQSHHRRNPIKTKPLVHATQKKSAAYQSRHYTQKKSTQLSAHASNSKVKWLQSDQ